MSDGSIYSRNGTLSAVMQKFVGMKTRLSRKQKINSLANDERRISVARLSRCLTTLDLASLGVGSCGGTGMYVVSGIVAKEMAGPGVILSFIIAGVVSLISGLCYAEFGVRVPKTSGSAYTYSYVSIGEFVAFLIGWNLILEYLIGTASGASAISSMIDALTNRTLGNWMIEHLGKLPNIDGHNDEGNYPDIIAFLIVFLMTALVAAGVRNSVIFNNALNIVNALVWVFIVVAGLVYANWWNWTGDRFLPMGWPGVLKGAATCFYAYIGFDVIATTGDECKQPHKSIPYAIIASLLICMTCYVTVSAVLTLVVPYNEVVAESPLLEVFVYRGFWQAKYIVCVGAFASLIVSLLGSLFPMPRVIYAMAKDGLLLRPLGYILRSTETPIFACFASGSIAAVLALAISLRDLIEMMSIGTLLAYTLVTMCVLDLRYQPTTLVDEQPVVGHRLNAASHIEENGGRSDAEMNYGTMCEDEADSEGIMNEGSESGFWSRCSQRFSSRFPEASQSLSAFYERWTLSAAILLGLPGKMDRPTQETGDSASKWICLITGYLVIFNIFVNFGGGYIGKAEWWAILLLVLFLIGLIFLFIRICQQPQNPMRLAYMAPAVPLLPVCGLWFNTFLMLRLSKITWARFAIWCFIGAVVYFGYGIWHSNLEVKGSSSQELEETDGTAEENGQIQSNNTTTASPVLTNPSDLLHDNNK